jgi:hypothetical protein
MKENIADCVQLMETKYTKMETDSHLVIQSVRSDLTPALSKSISHSLARLSC